MINILAFPMTNDTGKGPERFPIEAAVRHQLSQVPPPVPGQPTIQSKLQEKLQVDNPNLRVRKPRVRQSLRYSTHSRAVTKKCNSPGKCKSPGVSTLLTFFVIFNCCYFKLWLDMNP